jgi:hypothetical protein
MPYVSVNSDAVLFDLDRWNYVDRESSVGDTLQEIDDFLMEIGV